MMLPVSAAMLLMTGATSSSADAQGTHLAGDWVSDCQPIGKGGRHGFITRVSFRYDRIRAEAQMFATSNCEAPTFKVTYRGHVKARRAADGSFSFDHTVDTLVLTPQANEVVALYNRDSAGRGCGLTGWKVNVAKSVAGRRCDPFDFATRGTTLYDAAWLEGDRLRFGAFPLTWANDTPGERPARPLPIAYHRVAR